MKAEMKKKHKKRFRVIMEIIFMALGILCTIMPSPFPLLVPIGIGVIRIISNAVKREKEAPPTPSIEYSNGARERRTSNSNKSGNQAKKSKNEQRRKRV